MGGPKMGCGRGGSWLDEAVSNTGMKFAAEKRMGWIALGVMLLDQWTKWTVERRLPLGGEQEFLPGFFKLVHWGNTGAAWSTFHGSNGALAVVSMAALGLLYWARRHFEGHRPAGQVALGLVFGGILGNLIDRVTRRHVVDFLYFHVIRRDGEILGFPAFNVADSAICTGVGIIFLLSWIWRADADGGAPVDAPKAS